MNLDQIGHAGQRQIHHAIEILPRQSLAFRRPLNFDDRTLGGRHEVQVDARGAVLGIAEVEREFAVHVPDADGRNLVTKHRAAQASQTTKLRERERERDESAGHGRGPRATVCLEHVAIDDDRAFAELVEVESGPKRSPDQPLNFAGAAGERLVAAIARLAPARICAGMHLVLGRDPAASLTLHEFRHAIVHGRRDQHDRSTGPVQDTPLGKPVKTRHDLDRSNGPQIASLSLSRVHRGSRVTRIVRMGTRIALRALALATASCQAEAVIQRGTLRVSEIFESIQGEGPSAGAPSVFLRLAACNLKCTWCDTKYTWDWAAFRYEDEVRSTGADEVAQRIVESASRRLVITGGEPLIQRRELEHLLQRLPSDLHVEVETNGTLVAGAALESRIDQWNVSPKLANSGEPPERRLNKEVLAAFRDTGRAFLKVVTDGEGDRDEIENLLGELDWPRDKVLLMPQASTRTELSTKTPVVSALAERMGVRTSPRLHVLQWNGQRGK